MIEAENPTAVWVAGPPNEVHLKKTVIIGHVDCNAASCRALLGIDMDLEYWTLAVDQLKDTNLACRRLSPLDTFEREFEPLQVLNCKYEEFSLIIVNTVVKNSECHFVTDGIYRLIQQWKVEKIIVLTTVLVPDLPIGDSKANLYENAVFCNKLTENPSLPEKTKIRDGFLNSFLQFNLVEKLPLHCFIIPTYKCREGTANNKDDSKQNIRIFQTLLQKQYKLRFNEDLSCQLVLRRSASDEDESQYYT